MDTENLEPTVEYTDEETGELVIKELAKEFLSKGAWSTMMFLYQEKKCQNGRFWRSEGFHPPLSKAAGRFQTEKQIQHFEQGTGKSDYRDFEKVV